MTADAESWLALLLVERIGGKTLRRLLDAFGTAGAVLEAAPEDISKRCALPPELAGRIAGARTAAPFRKEQRLVAQHGVRLIPMTDPAYPAALGSVHLPPPLLYCKGTWPLADGPWIAVVGTRGRSRYGEKMTRRLVSEVAQAAPSAVIVSGLARGIDTAAHEEALTCGLHTVAVLGGGLTGIYPRENRALAERIEGQGALLSEFPMAARPLARNFPIRNRVIAGLSGALVVVEAGARSGALITSSFALNYGRPVLAVPGNADQATSEGTNRLLQSGQAAMALTGADVLAALRGTRHEAATQMDWLAPAAGRSAPPAAPREAPRPLPEGDKGRILECLGKGPLHPDELAGETALPIERLIALLLELELSGEIYQTAENHYALA